mgnify:FL=1|jgi:hypothetical protein
MKKNFKFNRFTNEWVHKTLPLSIDNELFSEMSENEINELIRRKTLSLDKNNLTDDEITSEFSKLRNKLKMNESFKCFFTKKAHSNR